MSKIKNFKERMLNKFGRNINQTIISQGNSTNIQAGRSVKVVQREDGFLNVQATEDLDVIANNDRVTIKGDKQSVEVRNGVIYVNGRSVRKEDGSNLVAEHVHIHLYGDVRNISGSIMNVLAYQNISGRISVTGDLECAGDIQGNIDTTGDIVCRGNIKGDIDCSGSVTCSGKVDGSIQSSHINFKR